MYYIEIHILPKG